MFHCTVASSPLPVLVHWRERNKKHFLQIKNNLKLLLRQIRKKLKSFFTWSSFVILEKCISLHPCGQIDNMSSMCYFRFINFNSAGDEVRLLELLIQIETKVLSGFSSSRSLSEGRTLEICSVG